MRRSIDDGGRNQRCGAVRAGNTTAAGSAPSLQTRRSVWHPQAPTAPLDGMDRLRRVAVHLETADVLERRAASSGDPVLAALLRERATAHRRTAERLRSG